MIRKRPDSLKDSKSERRGQSRPQVWGIRRLIVGAFNGVLSPIVQSADRPKYRSGPSPEPGSTDGVQPRGSKRANFDGKRCRVSELALCSGPGGRRFKSSLPDQSFQFLRLAAQSGDSNWGSNWQKTEERYLA